MQIPAAPRPEPKITETTDRTLRKRTLEEGAMKDLLPHKMNKLSRGSSGKNRKNADRNHANKPDAQITKADLRTHRLGLSIIGREYTVDSNGVETITYKLSDHTWCNQTDLQNHFGKKLYSEVLSNFFEQQTNGIDDLMTWAKDSVGLLVRLIKFSFLTESQCLTKKQCVTFFKANNIFKEAGLYGKGSIPSLLATIERGPNLEIIKKNLEWSSKESGKEAVISSLRGAIAPLIKKDHTQYRKLIPSIQHLYAKYRVVQGLAQAIRCYQYLILAIAGLELDQMTQTLISDKVEVRDAKQTAREEMLSVMSWDAMSPYGNTIARLFCFFN